MVVGCGSQLSLKLFRDVIKKDFVAVAESMKEHIGLLNECFFMKNPLESNFVVFLDDVSAERFLPSLLNSKLLVICCNRTPYQKFVRMAGEYGYSAAASLHNIEDLNKKINKAISLPGLKYIEIFCPCPSEWDYDTSLTVDLSVAAGDSGIWPLFEIENRKVILGPRPAKLSVLESFHSIQNKHQIEPKDVDARWKELINLSIK